MPLEPNGPAPYTTSAAIITALDAYRDRGLATIVTPEVLTRAGVPESISRRTLQSLKALGLIGGDSKPSPQWEEMGLARGDEEYRGCLQEWLRGTYADILRYADPATHSLDRITEAFRSYEPAGQRRAMAALLLGLWKYAGLPTYAGSDGPRAPSNSGSRAGRRPPRVATSRMARTTSVPPAAGATPGGLPPGLVGLLQQIPVGGQTWTSGTRDAFLSAFRAVLDFSVPVDDNTPSAPETGDEEFER